MSFPSTYYSAPLPPNASSSCLVSHLLEKSSAFLPSNLLLCCVSVTGQIRMCQLMGGVKSLREKKEKKKEDQFKKKKEKKRKRLEEWFFCWRWNAAGVVSSTVTQAFSFATIMMKRERHLFIEKSYIFVPFFFSHVAKKEAALFNSVNFKFESFGFNKDQFSLITVCSFCDILFLFLKTGIVSSASISTTSATPTAR